MRILYFSDYAPDSPSFIQQDVEEMSKRHEVLYIATCIEKKDNSRNYKSITVNYPISSLKSRLLWRIEKLQIFSCWSNKKFRKQLSEKINEFNPDIIHCQFAYEGLKLFDNYETTKPIFVNFRGYDASYKLKNKSYVKRLKKILSKANVFPIFVCQALKNNLEKHHIPINTRSLVLYTGVNTIKFTRTNFNQNVDPFFIQTGNFNDKKGQEITVFAFNKFLMTGFFPNAKLIFIGAGKNLEKVKNIVKSLNLEQQVEFRGEKSQNEIIELLNLASVFVHHSITAPNGDQEGIPNAIVEAMSMEMPILSTYHSGIPELVEHAVNGLLCKEKDIAQFANQMLEIATWQFLPINREKVKKTFDFEKHINLLDNFYSSVNDE